MSKLIDWRPLTMPQAVKQWFGARKRLMRLVARHDHPVPIEREARKMVAAGLVLTQRVIQQDHVRADLACTCLGMVDDRTASVMEIWLGIRRWRTVLPMDAPVDDALRDLAPLLYLRYGAVVKPVTVT